MRRGSILIEILIVTGILILFFATIAPTAIATVRDMGDMGQAVAARSHLEDFLSQIRQDIQTGARPARIHDDTNAFLSVSSPTGLIVYRGEEQQVVRELLQGGETIQRTSWPTANLRLTFEWLGIEPYALAIRSAVHLEDKPDSPAKFANTHVLIFPPDERRSP